MKNLLTSGWTYTDWRWSWQRNCNWD